ncbi:hypothetical protein [Cysteiniphilum halobium]|uniref:hypothetical protein n=1 Tax=Cysteiniphilum halobium TaxID=2219059 RepID=UPI000E6582E9|nr:hypothetical protein [Cysteiniphilum halobium]
MINKIKLLPMITIAALTTLGSVTTAFSDAKVVVKYQGIQKYSGLLYSIKKKGWWNIPKTHIFNVAGAKPDYNKEWDLTLPVGKYTFIGAPNLASFTINNDKSEIDINIGPDADATGNPKVSISTNTPLETITIDNVRKLEDLNAKLSQAYSKMTPQYTYNIIVELPPKLQVNQFGESLVLDGKQIKHADLINKFIFKPEKGNQAVIQLMNSNESQGSSNETTPVPFFVNILNFGPVTHVEFDNIEFLSQQDQNNQYASAIEIDNSGDVALNNVEIENDYAGGGSVPTGSFQDGLYVNKSEVTLSGVRIKTTTIALKADHNSTVHVLNNGNEFMSAKNEALQSSNSSSITAPLFKPITNVLFDVVADSGAASEFHIHYLAAEDTSSINFAFANTTFGTPKNFEALKPTNDNYMFYAINTSSIILGLIDDTKVLYGVNPDDILNNNNNYRYENCKGEDSNIMVLGHEVKNPQTKCTA